MLAKETPAPRIVVFDIETAPSRGFVWGKWEQDVIYFDQPWYILSFAWQVVGEKTVHVKGLCDYDGYSPTFPESLTDDKALVADLWKLFDEADVLVAHNGDGFDIKKANARFLYHGMTQPSGYKTVDTLKVMRRQFKLDSNKLDDVVAYLGLGGKLAHHGINTWKGCMAGDSASWKEMKAYNKHDVRLLMELYLKLRPWFPNHPNLNHWSRNEACPVCQSIRMQHRGYSVTKTGRSQRLQCQDCGSWSHGIKERLSSVQTINTR